MKLDRSLLNTIVNHRTILVFLTLLCSMVASEAGAKNYSFAWSANTESVEGYKLYYKKGSDATQPFNGTGATEGASPINVKNVTTFTITGLDENSTYQFALTAFIGTDESGYSQTITVNPSPQIMKIQIQ